jgi:hypothetical protein
MAFTYTGRAAPILLVALSALAACSPPALADAALPGIQLTRVAAPTRVAARDGVVVFGAYDAAAKATTLMRRSAGGTLGPVGVPPIPAFEAPNEQVGRPESVPPFEVTLGRDSGNRLTAVYRRCSAPADASCHLVLATIATGVERPVANTASALRGAISGVWIAFVKPVAGKADRLYLRHVDRRPMAMVPPPIDLRFAAERRLDPRGARVDPSSVRISSVDVRGRDVAYVVDYRLATPEIAFSELWLDRGHGLLRRVATVGTGGASSGFRELLQPHLYADSVVTYMQGRDQTNAVFRYSLGGRVLGAGSIGWGSGTGIGVTGGPGMEITSGMWDRGHFWFGADPYQGDGCAPFDAQPLTDTCPVLDSGPVRLVAPKSRR